MKNLILLIAFISSSVSGAELYPQGSDASQLFGKIFKNGGDAYCSANTCSLQVDCHFNISNDSKFGCIINDQVNVPALPSEEIFFTLFDDLMTTDTPCTDSYCSIFADCSYNRLDQPNRKNINCVIYQ